MAKENFISIPAHYNIYTGENNNRKLNIYFSVPENGSNKETGILLLIPGFGANSQSKVYKKMRTQFADKHNLIVIQCDYFGSEYMQKPKKVNLSMNLEEYENILSTEEMRKVKENPDSFHTIVNVLSNYSHILHATESLNENILSFNDMGFMQALDLLASLFAVKLIIEDNKLIYNKSKVIAYGHSHGAYLAYLCNRLAPDEFSLIIDNSAWLKPKYFISPRYVHQVYGKMILQVRFDYFARKINYDKQILSLPILYNDFDNKARIITFQGKDDSLVNYAEKKQFCSAVNNNEFYLIDEKKIDNRIFYSTSHGLNADFIHLFDYIMENTEFDSQRQKDSADDQTTIIKSGEFQYMVDFGEGLPIMRILSFKNG